MTEETNTATGVDLLALENKPVPDHGYAVRNRHGDHFIAVNTDLPTLLADREAAIYGEHDMMMIEALDMGNGVSNPLFLDANSITCLGGRVDLTAYKLQLAAREAEKAKPPVGDANVVVLGAPKTTEPEDAA